MAPNRGSPSHRRRALKIQLGGMIFGKLGRGHRVLRRIIDVRAIQGRQLGAIGVSQAETNVYRLVPGEVGGGKILTADVVGARAGEFVHDERGGKIVAGTGQDTENLLIRAANIMTVNERTGIARTWISSV